MVLAGWAWQTVAHIKSRPTSGNTSDNAICTAAVMLKWPVCSSSLLRVYRESCDLNELLILAIDAKLCMIKNLITDSTL